MLRKNVATLTVAAALAATATSATPAHARPALDPPTHADTHAPTQVTVTRPAGFAWPEALLGAGVAGALITAAASAGALRRRPSVPRITGTTGR